MGSFEGVEFVFLPIERAVKHYYKTKKYSCFLGGDEKLLSFYGSEIDSRYFSEPYMVHKSHLFSKDKEICDINEMNNKSLIVVGRFPHEKVFASVKLKRVERAQSVEQAIKMGLNGRADAFVSYFPVYELLDAKVKFCKELSFTSTKDKIHCYKSKSSYEFIKEWNKRFKILKNNKGLKPLLIKSFKGHAQQTLNQL